MDLKPVSATEQIPAESFDEAVNRIMLISSDRAAGTAVERLLRCVATPWELRNSASIDEALEITRQHAFSCVLLVDAADALEDLTWVPKFQRTSAAGGCPVVLVSGSARTELALEARRAGVASVVPMQAISTSFLELAVTSAVGQWRLMRVIDLLNQQVEEKQYRRDTQRQRAERFAHELLTPLASVQEYISLVFDEISGPLNAEQASHLAYARGGCASIEAAVEALVDAADNQDMNLVHGRSVKNGDNGIATIAKSLSSISER